MVSRDPESPIYRQVAGILRDRIRSGYPAAGQRLGAERDLAHEFGVSIATIGAAVEVLRAEGLLEPAVSGRAARVRGTTERATVKVRHGSRMWSRPASPDERAELGIEDGGWVTLVETSGRTVRYATGRTVFTFPDPV